MKDSRVSISHNCKIAIHNCQIFLCLVKFAREVRQVEIVTFYETLVIAMRKRGMRPADITAKTGIGSSFFSNLKSGHTKDVTWEKALLIIDALGMTPSEFYELSVSEQK